MCGITGIIDHEGLYLHDLEGMSNTLRHRGPDDEGYLVVSNKGSCFLLGGEDTIKDCQLPNISNFQDCTDHIIGMGHRRLSIIDLSANGHQPLNLGQLYIVYNGEIYNYIEIRNELISYGREFCTNTDTEVILQAYQQWGSDCVNRFVGMWSFAIFDVTSFTIFFSRDRYGIKPLYYYLDGHVFAFASEIKSLFSFSKIKRKVHDRNLIDFVNQGTIHDREDTLFFGVHEVPPGNNAFFDIKTFIFKTSSYYSLASGFSQSFSDAQEPSIYDNYSRLLKESIRLHLRSDVMVGSCLSGGLDSSAITAYCAQLSGNQLFHTVTASYHQPEIDESWYAKRVIESYPNISSHFTFPQMEDIWPDLEKLVWHQDLPLNSSSIFAQWEVMRLAKQNGIKVLLDGQGADEVLGGYTYFTGVFLVELFRNFRFREFQMQKRALKDNRSVNPTIEIAKVSMNLLPGWFIKPIINHNSLGKKVLNSEFVRSISAENEFRQCQITYHDYAIQSIKSVLRELLRYEDRNSMAHSIEARVPFLDHRLVDYSLSIPTKYKIKNGWTKYPIRKFLEPLAPPEIVWRKDKKGFNTPQLDWKNKSTEYLMDLLNPNQLPIYFDYSKVKQYLTGYSNSNKQLSEYWRLISILVWFKVNEIST